MEQALIDIIAHFRAKARHYDGMADAIEKEACELGLKATDTNVQERTTVRAYPRSPITVGLPTEATVENVRLYLKAKRARVRDLAEAFKVRKDIIRRMVENPANGMVIGDRGWVRLDEQQPLSFNHHEGSTEKPEDNSI